jgi:hypothetical protein
LPVVRGCRDCDVAGVADIRERGYISIVVTMTSYIPASYAGCDFATRQAAHDQLWSNDDCLRHGFSTSIARLCQQKSSKNCS